MKRLFMLLNIAFAGSLFIAISSSAQVTPSQIGSPSKIIPPRTVITQEITVTPQDVLVTSPSAAASTSSPAASSSASGASGRVFGGHRQYSRDYGRGDYGGRDWRNHDSSADDRNVRNVPRGTTLQRMRQYYINKATGRDTYYQSNYGTPRGSNPPRRGYYNRSGAY